ncbi:MAG TPA: Sua5 family C-terminal domain-containing protein, partial [Polyangiaceae bacterium]|nr:Sua5 family C-terminal domain-containing protein [Polyangiaceae bacterium]
PTTPEHVEKSLGEATLVVDGGPTGFGIESTIVDATRTPLVVLRRGSITLEDVAAIAEVVDRGDAVAAEGERAAAPGSMARHYAPRVPLTIAAADTLVADGEAGLVHRAGAAPPSGFARTITLPDDPRGYASGLYAALHALEDAGVARIVVESVPEDAAWAAVRDRLTRAAR